MESSHLKKIGFYGLIVFYLFAGFNHFRDPEFYYPLIPESFPYPELINLLSGVAEMILGIGMLITKTRKLAAYLLIIMLLAFIPSHWYFIEIGGCLSEGLCVPLWVAWIRLIIIHPLLIGWAYNYRNYSLK